MLLRRLDRLNRGRGGVAVIRGAAGMGKSSLLGAVEDQARIVGARVFHGEAAVMGEAAPLAPLLDALVATDDPPVDVDVLRQLGGSADQRFWVLRELEERLERAALAGPVVIGLDDIQWADPATLIAISVLPKRLEYDRILWLFSVRTGELAPPAQAALAQIRSTDATILTLDRLDDDAIAQVCEDLLGGRPDPAVREVIDRTLGHPFLLVELLHGLSEEGLVQVTDDEVHLAAHGVPRRMLDSVGAQVARLSPDTRDLLQMASVLGQRFSVDELAAIMDRQPMALLRPVREAIGAGLVVEDGERLSFRHDLVRESIDAGLPVAMRRAMQRRALEVMLEHGAPPSDVARLVMEVAQPGDLQAIAVLRRAAAEIAHVSPAVAAPLSRRALELAPQDGPLYGELVEETVGLLVSANLASEAMKLIATLTPGLIDPLSEARARSAVVSLMMQYEAGEAVKQCQLSLALPGLPATLRSQMFSFMSSSLELLGETGAAASAVSDAVSVPGLAGNPAKLLVTLLPQALIAFINGDWHGALALAQEAVAGQLHAEEYASSHLWLYDGWNAVILMAVGRLDQARAIIDTGSRAAIQEGITVNMRIWSMLRCRLLLYQGRLADARAEADAVLQMSDEIGEGARGYVNRIALYALATAATHTGDPAALRAGRSAALKLLALDDCRASMQTGAWIIARLNAVEGDSRPSAPLDVAALDPLATGSLRASDPRRYSDGPLLIHMLLDDGQPSDAADVAQRLQAAADRSPDFPALRATVAHAHALVQQDPELALHAVALYDHCPQPLVRALALEDAGALLPTSRGTEAVQSLDAALEIYTAAGAERDAARVRGLLRARGVRRATPSAPSSSRWPELSESELAVVELVARGATNREVADQLYLSPHTINAHLRHVFAKLGIRSRVELARLAGDRE
jgi:DNA-binding NarL/FixJ family response regulator